MQGNLRIPLGITLSAYDPVTIHRQCPKWYSMLEALIRAIYSDSSMRQATKVVKDLFLPYFNEEKMAEKNPKNILQEYSQKKWG